jgi:MarR family transcriptional regulator for hemolysin
MRRAMDAELLREAITIRQWEVLAWTAVEQDLSQAQLAERMGIEAPTLVGIVSRMERDGWLERCACPADRRKKQLRPTPKAEAVWEQMLECCGRVRARATQGISEQELAFFKGICEKMCSNLGTSLDSAGRSLACPAPAS